MTRLLIMNLIAVAAVIGLTPAKSQDGLLGWAICRFNCDAGRAADRGWEGVRDALQLGHAEREVSRPVRRIVGELSREVNGPLVAEWIRASKRDAIAAGVEPIPWTIRDRLEGYFPSSLLDRVRFRIGIGNEFALPANVFRSGMRGIALEEVIVFRPGTSLDDLWLWAHELTHVVQYDQLGTDEFARSYVFDSNSLEMAANANADRYASWLRGGNQTARVSASQFSTICEFTAGPRRGRTLDYRPMAALPVGTPCHDGGGSTGHVTNSTEDYHEPNVRLSTVCRFDAGPRRGQSQDYAPMPAIPVGASCQDGAGSVGVVVDFLVDSNPGVELSTLCQFTYGLLAGRVIDYAPLPPIPVGSPCHDGGTSTGFVIPRR